MFHGILYDDANIDEPAHRTEEKVMCSNTVAYHLVCLNCAVCSPILLTAVVILMPCRYGK